MPQNSDFQFNKKQVERLILMFQNMASTKYKRKAMHGISIIMKNNILQHFRDEKGSDNRKWQPLSPRYAEWKRKKFGNKTILRRRGKLYKSFQSSHSSKYAKVSTKIPYAKYHQYGTKRIPKRDFMYIDKKGIEDILKYTKEVFIESHLEAGK